MSHQKGKASDFVEKRCNGNPHLQALLVSKALLTITKMSYYIIYTSLTGRMNQANVIFKHVRACRSRFERGNRRRECFQGEGAIAYERWERESTGMSQSQMEECLN